MKYIEGPVPTIELTRRNLEVLLAKLDEPDSRRMLLAPGGGCYVRAVSVENEEHYSDRPAGPMRVGGQVI